MSVETHYCYACAQRQTGALGHLGSGRINEDVFQYTRSGRSYCTSDVLVLASWLADGCPYDPDLSDWLLDEADDERRDEIEAARAHDSTDRELP